jgi:ribosomal protein S18 acetylase RimI-like enzyme
MNEILTDLLESTLAKATKANLYAFFRYLSRSAQTQFYENLTFIRWHTAVPHPWFSGVLSTQPISANEEQIIQENLAYFKTHRVPIFTWWLEPQLQVAAWTDQLLPHGFGYDANTPGMAVDLATLLPSVPHPDELLIKPVDNLEALQTWTGIFIKGYEIPEAAFLPFFELLAGLGLDLPIRHYLGYLHNQPVATASLFLGAGVAGIYNVATLAEARGQGIGAALTLKPLHEARQMGYHAAVLQSSEMGYRVYQRLGFRKLCVMDHFFWKSE